MSNKSENNIEEAICDDLPRILNEFYDIYFISKPSFWNCTTFENKKDVDILKLQNNFMCRWICINLKIDDELKNNNDYSMGMINRLDYETSGIIIVAKTRSHWEKYRQFIKNHKNTLKIYMTLVNGSVSHLCGIITLPLLYNKSKNTTTADKKGKYAYTEYINVAEYEHDNKTYTFLLIKIKTGLTHQIRVHMKSIGNIIVCDKKYDETDAKKCSLSKRLFLHATFYMIDNKKGEIDLPPDLKNVLAKLTLKNKNMSISNAMKILKSHCITNNFINLYGIYK